MKDIKKKRGTFSKALSLVTIIIFIFSSGGLVLSDDSPSIAQYTAYPPFGGKIVKPNVLVNLDTSTSLSYFAYDFSFNAKTASTKGGMGSNTPSPSSGFSENETYYGYFDSSKYYKYNSANSEYEETRDKSAGAKGSSEWDGNFLNWLTMRRSDITKKALIGGKTLYRAGMITDSTDPHANDLVGDPPYRNSYYLGYQKEVDVAENYIGVSGKTGTQTFTFDNDEGWKGGMGRRWWDTVDIPSFSISSAYDNANSYRVVIHRTTEPKGVIQRVGNSVRWGLEVMNNGYWTTDGQMGGGGCHGGATETGGTSMGGMSNGIRDVAGGTVLVPVGYDNVNDMVIEVAEAAPYTPSTPIGESIWTATGYFMQYEPTSSYGPRYFSGATDRGRWGRTRRWGPRSTAASYPVGDDVDPYNYALDQANETKWVSCGDSFVITITDGEPTADLNIQATQKGYGSTYADPATPNPPGWADQTTYNNGDSNQGLVNYFWGLDGSHYVDNVALWSHVDYDNQSYRDLRDLSVKTNTDGSPVADNEEQYLTHYFIYAPLGGSGSPDGRRLLNWSGASGGGAARNGGFEESGTNYLPDIAGEYDSNPTDGNNDNFFEAQTGNELEAALLKALFDILAKTASGTAPVFAGSRGASGNGMIYQSYFYPEMDSPAGPNGERLQWVGYLKALEVDIYGNVSATPLWEAGEKLWEKDPSARSIYTTKDGTNLIEFNTGNGLDDYLRPEGTTAAERQAETANIINWIRGEDLSGITDSGHPYGYRNRKLTIGGTTNTWKLGDIVYSSPTPVETPKENYDRRYKDISYTSFYRTYKDRRNVVYAGANDGILHAFNGGVYCYDTSAAKYTYGTARDINGNCAAGGAALGEELWGFIPQQLLPHLKWLTDPNYTHVYYIDLKPKVTDVQIFTPDADHPNGWGTILIGGMRLGGKEIRAEISGKKETFYSAYFALDITNPEVPPKLLWTFTDQDSNSDGTPDLGLGLTTSYPAVARVKASDTDDLWVMIVGSGPTDYDAGSNVSSNQTGKVFVVDLKTGSLLKSFDTAGNAFMTDPITVDVNLDYKVDVAYIGESYDTGAGYMGNLYRIVTENSTDVNLWTLSPLYSPPGNKPVTSAPSAALDGKGNMWVFFGTGKFIGSDDLLTSDPQAFYGIKDTCKPWINPYDCTLAPAVTDLLDVSAAEISFTDTARTEVSISGVSVNNTCGSPSMIEWCDLIAAIDGKDGWVINFPYVPGHDSISGERSFAKPVVLGGLVIFTSYVPKTDICIKDDQGSGYLWAVYYETGTAYKDYVFTDETASKPDVVTRTRSLGEGFGKVSAMVTRGGSLKAFAQTSVGALVEIETETPFALTSGLAGWKTGECRQ